MAKYILANTVVLENLVLNPGKEIDDAQYDLAKLKAAGAKLDPINAETTAAAALLQKQKLRGSAQPLDAGQNVDAVAVHEDDDVASAQEFWYVDPVNGDNANDGASLLTPIQQVSEFTRRVKKPRYSQSFGPYQIHLLNDVPYATDSFQWSFVLDSKPGTLTNDPDSGVTKPIVQIIGATPTVVGSGVLTGYTAPAGNAKSTIARAAGTFVVGDVVEMTSGPAAGRRLVITEVTGGGLIGGINPYLLMFPGVVPGAGNTFNIIQRTKFGPEIQGSGCPQGTRIDLVNCEQPASTPTYEVVGITVRFLNCMLKTLVRPGLGSRIYLGQFGANPTAVVSAAQDFYTIERGTLLSLFTTWVNVFMDNTGFNGQCAMLFDEMQNGCIREGNPGELAASEQGQPSGEFGPCRIFDVPTVVPANPYIGTGGTDTAGAALIFTAGAKAKLNTGFFGAGPFVGNSVHAGTVGLDLSEAADVQLRHGGGGLPIVTGAAGDIRMDAGDVIPYIDPATGIPIAGSALTAWTGAGGYDDPATFNLNAMNLKNGTKLYKIA